MSIPGSLIPLFNSGGGGGYIIQRSLRFNSSDSAYLSRTPASAGNTRTYTWSGWVKKVKNDEFLRLFGQDSYPDYTFLGFYNNNKLYFFNAFGGLNGRQTVAVFRDTSAWYHVVIALDTTQATDTNRIKIYVNGVLQDTEAYEGTYSWPTLNQTTKINTTSAHVINAFPYISSYGNGYLADIHFIDGQALTPSSFGEFDATTGVWNPKRYTGTYGTNGFRLDFADNSAATAAALGKDTSGLGNNWTPNNLSIVTGGPTSVASASGGLPIYNTTDTYGATKGTGTRTDSNSSSIVLAVPMNGANNGTTFTDESATIKGSGSAKTINRFGDSKTSTVQSKFYGSSGYFDGVGDYLTADVSTDMTSTSVFTVEFWCNFTNAMPNGSAYSAFFSLAYSGGSEILYINAGAYGETVGAISFAPASAQTPAINNGQWRHVSIVWDGSYRKIFIDGIQQNSTAVATTRSYTTLYIGVRSDFLDGVYQGYLQDFRIYKGVAKYTSNFNPPSSTQNATVGAGCDSLVDSPYSPAGQTDSGAGGTVVGNYATLNPLSILGSASGLSNGNLTFTGGLDRGHAATFGMSSGKWYWELTMTSLSRRQLYMGITNKTTSTNRVDGYCSIRDSGVLYNENGATVNGAGSSAMGTGDVLRFAYDADNKQLFIALNNTWLNSSDPAAGTNASFTNVQGSTLYPTISDNDTTATVDFNFGQRQWAYAAPAGFRALCTANLPTPTIANGATAMDVVLWTGNGTNAGRSLTGLNFNPDLVWTKIRSDAFNHLLYDAVRGSGSGKELSSSSTAAEGGQSSASYGYLSSFDSSGFSFTPGTDAYPANIGWYNTTNRTYVAWCWDAGSSTVTNTQGGITSSVRANASAGFSVIGWTGASSGTATIGHGLNVAPSMIIARPRNATSNWVVYHRSVGNDAFLRLNTTDASVSSSACFGTGPTSTVFTLNQGNLFAIAGDCIGYAFAPVVGYSSFGSYTGNGSADGPFVYTGFRPRWVMIKNTNDSSASWWIQDSARSTFNVGQAKLAANLSDAENTAFTDFDFTSNGFKVRNSGTALNASSQTIIYAAFAESPFSLARAR